MVDTRDIQELVINRVKLVPNLVPKMGFCAKFGVKNPNSKIVTNPEKVLKKNTYTVARLVEFGRHKGLKIPRPKSRSGSSPEAGTKVILENSFKFYFFSLVQKLLNATF